MRCRAELHRAEVLSVTETKLGSIKMRLLKPTVIFIVTTRKLNTHGKEGYSEEKKTYTRKKKHKRGQY